MVDGFVNDRVEKISHKIKEWYDSGCKNMDLENVYIGKIDQPGDPSKRRPQYEKL